VKNSKHKLLNTKVYADRHISPFEGSPRAGAAEYVLGGMFIIRPKSN